MDSRFCLRGDHRVSSQRRLGTCVNIDIRLSPMVTPGFREVIADYKVSLDQVSTYLVGVLVLATGTSTFFTSAAATVWGKRPVFVISIFVLLVTCVWGFYATVSIYCFPPNPVTNLNTELCILGCHERYSRCSWRAYRNSCYLDRL
jgi:hypothetical protein